MPSLSCHTFQGYDRVTCRFTNLYYVFQDEYPIKLLKKKDVVQNRRQKWKERDIIRENINFEATDI